MDFVIFIAGFVAGALVFSAIFFIYGKKSDAVSAHMMEQMKLYFENTANKVLQANSQSLGEQNKERLEEFFKRFKDKIDDFEKRSEENFKFEAENFTRFDVNIKSFIEAGNKISHDTTKYVLRKAASKRIPEAWYKRRKKGFPVPIIKWFREEKYYNIAKEMFKQDFTKEFFDQKALLKLLDDHYKGKKNNCRKIWTVYVFLVWYKEFFIDFDKVTA